MAAQCCLQRPHGSSCVRSRDCTHGPTALLGTSVTASPGRAGRGESDGWGQAAQGCAVEGMIATKSDFILGDVSPASLAAQHPVCMRQS